jgi:hypothetical protein
MSALPGKDAVVVVRRVRICYFTYSDPEDTSSLNGSSATFVVVETDELTISPRPDEGIGERLRRADEYFHEEFADASAESVSDKLRDTVWRRLAAGWATNDPSRITETVQNVTDVKDKVHQFLLGKPVEFAGSRIGLPDGTTVLLGNVAEHAPLPVEKFVMSSGTLIEIGAMAVGLATGNLMLFSACLKALTYKGLGHTLTEVGKAILSDIGLIKESQPAFVHIGEVVLSPATPAQPARSPVALPSPTAGPASRGSRTDHHPGASRGGGGAFSR